MLWLREEAEERDGGGDPRRALDSRSSDGSPPLGLALHDALHRWPSHARWEYSLGRERRKEGGFKLV